MGFKVLSIYTTCYFWHHRRRSAPSLKPFTTTTILSSCTLNASFVCHSQEMSLICDELEQ